MPMAAADIFEAVRLSAAGYFLILATAALFGWHEHLLKYPFKVVYSFVRLVLLAATLGRIKMAPVTRKASRRSKQRFQSITERFSKEEDDGEEIESFGWNDGADPDKPMQDPFDLIDNPRR